MAVMALQPTLRDVARNQARANVESEPQIQRIYLFPHADQVRLVAVDPITLPSGRISPYYFDPDPQGGVPYSCAIALITPEDETNHIPTPPGWRDWNKAIRIWPES